MRKYTLIGIGGFLGAILRYLIKSASTDNDPGQIPFVTLIINLFGCLLLSLLLTLFLEEFEIGPNIRLGLSTGLLGAFTTFGTICKEINTLLRNDFFLYAIIYAAISLIFGLFATVLGYRLAELIISSKSRRHHARSIISRNRRRLR